MMWGMSLSMKTGGEGWLGNLLRVEIHDPKDSDCTMFYHVLLFYTIQRERGRVI